MDPVGQSIRMPNLREGYVALGMFIRDHGVKIAPRGQATREIRHATLIVEDARDTYPTGIGRNLNNGIAAVESAQLLAGESRPKLVMRIGPQFSRYVEDDGLFHGAYGVRTRGQFAIVVDRLREDPSSRQAVVTLWRPDLDLMKNKKDYPCTVMYDFLIRDDKLVMEVVMRSNDFWLGLAYDGFQHSRVQIAIASALGIPAGEYVHHAVSLHLYDRDLEKIEQLTNPQKTPDIYPSITGPSWSIIHEKARSLLDAVDGKGDQNGPRGSSARWYIMAMRNAIEANEKSAINA